MFCKHCGSELPEGAKFCNECGAPVESEEQKAQDESVVASDTSSSQGTPSKTKFKKWLILAIIIVVALIVVIVVAVRVHSNNVGEEYADDASAVSANNTEVDDIYNQYIKPSSLMAGNVYEVKSDGIDSSDAYEVDSDMFKSFKKAFAKVEAISISSEDVYNIYSDASWEQGSTFVDLVAWDDSDNLVFEILGGPELGVILSDINQENIYLITSDQAIAAFTDIENEILEKYYEDIESEEAALVANVTITNVEVSPIQEQDKNGHTTKEYVVSMLISNENDISCDITPSIKATVEVADNYGEYKVEETTDIEASSPYCRENSLAAGLAPHETKTVCYYLEYIWTETAAEVYFDDDDVQILDVELLDFSVEQAPYEYIAVSEWGSALSTETTIETYMDGDHAHVSLVGDIQNNTGEKWKSVTVWYAFQINDSDYGGYQSKSFDYINVDEIINLNDDESYDFKYYVGESIEQVEIIPTLLWYEPDEDE